MPSNFGDFQHFRGALTYNDVNSISGKSFLVNVVFKIYNNIRNKMLTLIHDF